MKGTLYILACLVIPAVWGLLVSSLYDKIAARRAKTQPEDKDNVEMYHI